MTTTITDEAIEARAKIAETAVFLIRLGLPDAFMFIRKTAPGLSVDVSGGEFTGTETLARLTAWQNALGFDAPIRRDNDDPELGYDLVSTGVFEGVPIELKASIYPFQETGS